MLCPVNANELSSYENSIFFVRTILLPLEITRVIKSGTFVRLLETSISMNSFIAASGNVFFVYWKQFCFILSFFR